MRIFSGIIRVLLFIPIIVSSCYDDSELWEHIRDHEYRITKLEDYCNQINNNISSLQSIIEAIQSREFVKDVIPVYTEGYCTGYTITFNGRDPISLFNGKNGTDAKTPIIGVKKDTNGVWYWTLNGNWLLDENGSRVMASGRDGTDGTTPKLKIEDDYWWVSYDNGINWERLSPVVVRNDINDSSVIKSISQDQHFVTIVLANGETIQLTKYNPYNCQSDNYFNIENVGVQVYHKVIYNNFDYSYSCINYLTAALASPYCEIPNGKEIITDIDETATTRSLEYADSPLYINSHVIQLDLYSKKYVLYNLEGNKTYYYRVYKDAEPYLLLNSGQFNTIGTIRQLRIEAAQGSDYEWLTNIRDIGGWDASNNRKLRYGVIIRGPELNHVNNGKEDVSISDSGVIELKRLGISAEMDLRSIGEIRNISSSVLGSDVEYYNHPVDQWFYRLNVFFPVKRNATIFADAIRQILLCIKDNQGVYIHCAGGADRTGVLCALIEGLCGVSENDINHDYELSNRDRSREYHSIKKGDYYDGDFKFAIEYIKGLQKFNNHFYVYYRGEFYDVENQGVNSVPTPITDTELIKALSANTYGTLQSKFKLLMELGGLTFEEMNDLEMLLCS